jgi:hypothetical protein
LALDTDPLQYVPVFDDFPTFEEEDFHTRPIVIPPQRREESFHRHKDDGVGLTIDRSAKKFAL